MHSCKALALESTVCTKFITLCSFQLYIIQISEGTINQGIGANAEQVHSLERTQIIWTSFFIEPLGN